MLNKKAIPTSSLSLLETLFGPTNLLEVGIGRDFGVLTKECHRSENSLAKKAGTSVVARASTASGYVVEHFPW